ncbi:hypothetical protein PFLA_b0316 [Pseudoalteromonas flavipulchra NCIMB 2033 = ATCC BAA-314]|nr:hypothetical protein [Pseudoalteromonas flavipulchra NCIMB 2033 = ATCC BAA-314]
MANNLTSCTIILLYVTPLSYINSVTEEVALSIKSAANCGALLLKMFFEKS